MGTLQQSGNLSPLVGQGEQRESNFHMNVNLSIIKSWWLAGMSPYMQCQQLNSKASPFNMGYAGKEILMRHFYLTMALSISPLLIN